VKKEEEGRMELHIDKETAKGVCHMAKRTKQKTKEINQLQAYKRA